MAANRAAFDRWRIVPRMLVDTSSRDLGVTLFGRRLPAPLLLAPIGVLEMVHAEADVAVARAAASTGVPMIMSSQASRPMEECAEVMGDAPRWFQLYWSQSTELALSFVRRAERSGCDALVLTLDTTSLGWRPRDLDLAYLPFIRGKGIAQYTSDPVFQRQVEEDLETFERDTGRVTPDRRVDAARDGAGVPGQPARQRHVQRTDGGGAALHRDLLQDVAELGRRRVPARAHRPADRAEGHPAPRRRPPGPRHRCRRGHRLQPRRATGRRCRRVAGRPARGRRRGRR